MKKRILVLGLGKFGREVVDCLVRGAEDGGPDVVVYAVDRDQTTIEKYRDKVHTAAFANLQEQGAVKELLKELGMTPDVAIVSLGDSLEASILATLDLVERQVPRILVKGLHETHRTILNRIVEGWTLEVKEAGPVHPRVEVLIPELDAARQLAERLPSDFVFESLSLSEDASIQEVRCPDKFKGKTLADLQLRQKYGVTVLGMRMADSGGEHRGHLSPLPADKAIPGSCTLTIMGSKKDLQRFRRDFEAS